jgi:uncharacterized protein DUF4230
MFKQRLAIIVLLLTMLAGVGLGLFLPHWATSTPAPKLYNTATLLQQVQTLSQLVTVKYVLEKVVVLEDVKWISGLGESRVLMVAHGIVKAGLDLKQLQPADLQISNASVLIKLPPAQITDAYLDEKETRVVERTTGLLRSFDKDLEQTARQNAVDDIRRAARTGGILKDADERARAQVRNLFKQLGFEKVEFRD